MYIHDGQTQVITSSVNTPAIIMLAVYCWFVICMLCWRCHFIVIWYRGQSMQPFVTFIWLQIRGIWRMEFVCLRALLNLMNSDLIWDCCVDCTVIEFASIKTVFGCILSGLFCVFFLFSQSQFDFYLLRICVCGHWTLRRGIKYVRELCERRISILNETRSKHAIKRT